MNDILLEQLLNEDESSSLDFKKEQYPCVGASDEQKSELIKDILAFTNAGRRTDAYILIGVEEVKGGRSRVVGVQQHLEDASLQELVNSKTQRPVEFSYRGYPFEGLQLGIITIALQEHPVFLDKKDYGKLRKHVVYIRRSSSTSEAKPDEIASMGAAALVTGSSNLLTTQLNHRLKKQEKLNEKYEKMISGLGELREPRVSRIPCDINSIPLPIPGMIPIAIKPQESKVKIYHEVKSNLVVVLSEYLPKTSKYLKETKKLIDWFSDSYAELFCSDSTLEQDKKLLKLQKRIIKLKQNDRRIK